jgi:hypothetical protein
VETRACGQIPLKSAAPLLIIDVIDACRPELLKIVHVFFGQNAVLFEFARLKLTAADASFRAPYIIKDSISWENVASADGFEIHH